MTNIHVIVLGSNPFLGAFQESDWLGKLIFLSLFALSIISWTLLIRKVLQARHLQQLATKTKRNFASHKQLPLGFQQAKSSENNPFLNLYSVLKRSATEILYKNQTSYLSSADIDLVGSHVDASIAREAKEIEKNIYILPTVVSLAPFLGLLGTVWGILITLSELQNQAAAGSSHQVMGGISMALGTTVLGLLVAIPPLIGYNYLKSTLRDLRLEMHDFAATTLAAVELQYRKVDVS